MAVRSKYKLDLYRGDTYRRTFRFWSDKEKTIPYPLDGVTVKAEIRDKTAGLIVIQLATTVDAVETNAVHLEIGVAQWTLGIPEKGVWDLQFTYPDTSVYTPIVGPIAVTGDVTESAI